ncbi:glycoside hydrolase family 16 protein [Urechidicola croceus]|uniref:Laminarinase n=1 Tax=Urechidicola croceus TaxID=1850246 RepID=A0A1D8P7Y7_9FLAO|nr:glycoside hydrolase family 16 protein [Urechidicola croceus]AOW20694.1 laminarinase [Urechidicola croceus]
MKNIIYLLLLTIISCKNENNTSIIFEENFDGNQLNEEYWNFELGDGCPELCGWGNNESQFYTKENISFRDGNLVITAVKDSVGYTSSKITTAKKIEFQYGTIEARAKVATGQGIWPAIWMLGSDIKENGWPVCGEIDVLEYVGKEPKTVYTTLHTPKNHGGNASSKKTRIDNIEEGFHVYKANWTKDKIDFLVDDILVYSYSPKMKDDKNWPFDKPFYIILNLAVGGNFGGPEVDDSIFPQEFIIDYVKVYQ